MITDDLSILEALLAFVVTFVAYLVKGFTGFGAGVVMVPVLLLVMDLKLVVFAACVCAVANGIALSIHSWRHVAWRAIAGVLAGLVVGLVVGVEILATLSGHALKMWFGVLVCVFAVKMLWQELRVRQDDWEPWPAWLGPFYGSLGGIIMGVYGGGGPAIVVYLVHRLRGKNVFRASCIVLFFIGDVLRLGGYVWERMMTREALILSCITVPAALVGGYLGTKVQDRVEASTFRLLVAGLLLAIGALLVASSR